MLHPESREPDPESRKSDHETRVPNIESRDPKLETRNPKLGNLNPNPESRNPKPEARKPLAGVAECEIPGSANWGLHFWFESDARTSLTQKRQRNPFGFQVLRDPENFIIAREESSPMKFTTQTLNYYQYDQIM
jgi:hypothetical protein